MSHGSDEGENYWPGYVDALTSMVQVLAFVMMLLSMAIFVLSQNAAENALAAIAKAENVDMPKNTSVSQLTDAIIEKIRSKETLQASVDQARQASKAAAEGAKTAQAAPAENRSNESASSVATGGRTVSSQSVESLLLANRLSVAIPVNKQALTSSASDKRISVRFRDRSYELDVAEAANIAAFVDAQHVVERNLSLGVRAYANSGSGRLTEERRVGYYRALVVRGVLIDRKMFPGRLQLNVFDTSDSERGLTVDIFVVEPGNNAR